MVNTKQVDEVKVEATTACTFSAHCDEMPDEHSWQEVTASPVKSILDMFRQEGAAQIVRRPYGRTFKLDGRASTPPHCNYVQFQAHVPTADLEGLLRISEVPL